MERFAASKVLQAKSHQVIPGGAHTYAKGDDQYPVLAPGFIARGEGCMVWDVDGNEFIEYGMGLRAVALGHAYKPVIEAAIRQLALGSNFTRPAPIELACAEQLLDLIPNGEMVKFAKNGSDVTTAAVKLARAATGRRRVAICGDQPFYSVDDWFIGTTPMDAGIPSTEHEYTVKFRYNDMSSLIELFARYPSDIACVLMEAETTRPPQPDFLHDVQQVCRTNGALFVLDEMITGFRWHTAGAQGKYGLSPDLSAFGKALGNGFSVAALVGRRDIMEMGGLYHEKERVFLLSTTHGAETHALAAAIETMRTYTREDVIGTLYRQGSRLMAGARRVASELGIEEHFQVEGQPCNLIYVTRDQMKAPSQAFRALFLQELIQRGVLAPSFVVSYSHTDAHIDRTIEVIGEALRVYKQALENGVEQYLVGRPVKPVFRRFN